MGPNSDPSMSHTLSAFSLTVKLSSTVPSLTVTVAVAVPRLLVNTVNAERSADTDIVATSLLDETAVTFRASPPRSSNTPDRETCLVPPSLTIVELVMSADAVGGCLSWLYPYCVVCDTATITWPRSKTPAFTPWSLTQYWTTVLSSRLSP